MCELLSFVLYAYPTEGEGQDGDVCKHGSPEPETSICATESV